MTIIFLGGASDDEDSVGGLPSDDELYNVGKVRYVKGGNLSESSDDDADAKAGWVYGRETKRPVIGYGQRADMSALKFGL